MGCGMWRCVVGCGRYVKWGVGCVKWDVEVCEVGCGRCVK